MWLIFLVSAIIIALTTTLVAWIIHKVVNSMIRDDMELRNNNKEGEK